MLTLDLKNKHIYFSVESIWADLDYRFRTQLNTLCVTNPDDEYVQTINVSVATLLQCYKSVSGKPHGVTEDINIEILSSLKPQLIAASNMAALQTAAAENQQAQADYQSALSTYHTALDAYNENPIGDAPTEPGQPVPIVVVPNEYSQALIQIGQVVAQNQTVRDAKIENGKEQILAP